MSKILVADSWLIVGIRLLMDDNGCQIMSDDNSLYR